MESTAERQREAKKRWARQQLDAVAEIGPHPERDDDKWERYRDDLLLFLQECFPHSTGIHPFSPAHERAIRRIQQIILRGGLELRIVYRGWAKSTIAENAAIWAAGYGHRGFFLLIAADDMAAKRALSSIQSEFETNPRLMAIFPEACWPALKLDGVAMRASKQRMSGKQTHMEWTKQECVLPTVEGFAGSGAIILPRGITASIRGLRKKRVDGTQARPDFVMIDDPQTDESAGSPSQCKTRLDLLNKSILRLGGHFTQMACVINATVIEPDDMIDQLSDRRQYPAWRTERIPMLISFADAHETLWLGKYADIRTSHDPEDDDDRQRAQDDATAFYRDNRVEMDAGAEASWEHCYDSSTELSAIQHAYNILIDTTEEAFMAECQNQPVKDTSGLEMLSPGQMSRKVSGFKRGQFSNACGVLTAFVDVHPSILYWQIWAWEPTETGYCIDYGVFPDQRRKYFSHNSIRHRLQKRYPGQDLESTIHAGLGELTDQLLSREYIRDDGVPLRIQRCLIDANGEAADAVKSFIRQSPHAAILTPSFGKGITAKQMPMSRWEQSRKPGIGPEWVPTKGKKGEPPGVLFDTNYWKTRFHRRFSLPVGSKGALYLFEEKPDFHRLVADHFDAEKPTEVQAGSRIIYEWRPKPGTDNHFFDCGVGAAVAASLCGIRAQEPKRPKPRKRRKVREF